MNDDLVPVPVHDVGRMARAVLDSVGSVVVGKRDSLQLVLELIGLRAGACPKVDHLPQSRRVDALEPFEQQPQGRQCSRSACRPVHQTPDLGRHRGREVCRADA